MTNQLYSEILGVFVRTSFEICILIALQCLLFALKVIQWSCNGVKTAYSISKTALYGLGFLITVVTSCIFLFMLGITEECREIILHCNPDLRAYDTVVPKKPKKLLNFESIANDMGIRLIRKLPQRILDSVFSKLTIYQIMRLYHTADLDFESANERLRECCSQNRITNCHNLNNAEKIYRLILDKSSSFFPQNEPVLMTCNNFLQNLFLSKFTDLKTFNIEFIVTYGGMRDGIMEISIPSKSGDTGRIVVTIANDEKQFEDQETTKISLTLDVQKKDRRDTERRNAMFYDKKPDRLYCAQWKYDNTVDIHYMTPGQDQPVKVLSTPNTCVKLQSPHISVDQEHLFLIFSCQHDTYIMYYNAKTKECIWHEVNGHFQDMFQWANQLLIRTEDGLTHISADHTMLRSTWSTSISNSIRMTESVYAFHQNSYVSFAFIENGMFKIKKTMIYAGELAKLKRRCSSILTVKDGFGSNTYFFEVFNGNLVYDKISRRLVYDNASA